MQSGQRLMGNAGPNPIEPSNVMSVAETDLGNGMAGETLHVGDCIAGRDERCPIHMLRVEVELAPLRKIRAVAWEGTRDGLGRMVVAEAKLVLIGIVCSGLRD